MAKISNSLCENLLATICAFIFCCSCLFADFRVVCFESDKSCKYKLDVDAYAVKNHRSHMEDRYFVDEKIDGTHISVFAVFDGHGGKLVSSKARSDLMPRIRKKIQGMVRMKKARRRLIAKSDDKIKRFSAEYYVKKFGKNDNNLVEAFKQMLHDEILDFDEEMQLEPENNYCGSTAVIAIVSGHYLIVANVGDSRAVLANTSDKAIRITKDHKPDDPVEKARIESVKNGKVTLRQFDVPRVNNILAMSRALGNIVLKRKKVIIATPDLFVIDFRQYGYQPKYLVIASDGIWDVLGDQEVIDLINDYAYTGSVAKQIAQDAINWYSHDNIAILVITFDKKANADSSDDDDDDEDGVFDEVEDGAKGSEEITSGKHEEL